VDRETRKTKQEKPNPSVPSRRAYNKEEANHCARRGGNIVCARACTRLKRHLHDVLEDEQSWQREGQAWVDSRQDAGHVRRKLELGHVHQAARLNEATAGRAALGLFGFMGGGFFFELVAARRRHPGGRCGGAAVRFRQSQVVEVRARPRGLPRNHKRTVGQSVNQAIRQPDKPDNQTNQTNQTTRQSVNQTVRQTRQSDNQTNQTNQTDRHTDRQTDRQAGMHKRAPCPCA